MNEKALSREFHRVADAVTVPDDLFPSDLAVRHSHTRRRQRWLGAAAAAALLLVFLITPLGARTVTAAGELIMQYTVRLIRTEMPAESLPYIDAGSVQPGQTVVKDTPGSPKQVAEGLLLSQLEAGWPLPTYRAPGPDARVVRVTTYQQNQTLDTGVTVSWRDSGGALHYTLHRRTEPFAATDLERLRSGEMDAVTVYTNDRKARVEQKSVVLKGQPATATRVGQNWSLYWWYEYGGGSIAGNVDLDELVKIAESLPTLNPAP